ncbi:MAG: translocation/assembly module TamB [Bacteroidales bacterium]|nr:translocation/assembly module TamB [Candidatus Latescibacterota bacterium]
MVKRILKSKITSWISLIIALSMTAIIVLLLIFRTDFFALRASQMLTKYFFAGTSFSLHIDRLSGNPLKNVTFDGLYVRFNGADYSYDVVRIERFQCEYELNTMFSMNPVIKTIIFEKPHIWIKPDTSGINIFPHSRGGRTGTNPSFEIRRFVIREGQFIYQGPKMADAVRRIDLDGRLTSDSDGLKINIETGSGEDIRRMLYFRNINGSVQWSNDDGDPDRGSGGILRLEDLFLELDESTMIVNGTVDPDSMFFDLNVAAEPLEVEEITRALGIQTTQYGELQGALAVRGVPGTLDIRGMVNGIFSGYALESFRIDMSWKSPVLHMNRGWGRFNGSEIDGTGEMILGDDSSVSLQLDVKELDLSAGFVRGANLPETMLNGSISMDYGPAPAGLRFDLDLQEGHFREIPFDSGKIIGGFIADTITFHSIILESPTHDIRSDGLITTSGGMRFYFDLNAASQDSLFPYFGIEEYRADVSLNGIWEGNLKEWDLIANGEFSDLEYRFTSVSEGDIKLILRRGESSKFLMEMEGDTCYIGPIPFDDVVLSLEYMNGTTDIKKLLLSRPGFSGEASVSVHSDDGIVSILVQNAEITAMGEDWMSGGDPGITLESGKIDFYDMQLHSKMGALYLDGNYDSKERMIDGVLRFERLGLSLIEETGIVSFPLRGRSLGSLSLSGSIDDPSLLIDFSTGPAVVDSIDIDGIRLTAEYSDGKTAIDTMSVVSPGGNLFLSGSLSGLRYVEAFRGSGSGLDELVLDIQTECDKLEMEPFLRMTDRSFFDGGKFTGTISVRDSLVHPSINMEGTIDSLASDPITLYGVRLDASVDKEGFLMEGSLLCPGGKEGLFNGKIPVEESDWFYSPAGNEPLYLELNMEESDLADFPEMTEVVAEADGRYSVGLRIDGTFNDPKLHGELNLFDGSFRFSGMEERFRDVNAKVILEDTLITISSLAGREGRDGTFDCGGTIILDGWRPSRYDLTAHLDKFLLASITDIMAIVSGDLKVGNLEHEGRLVPSITGMLDVNRAEVYFDIGEFSSTSTKGTMEAPSWFAEIELEARGNTWIKTPDANVEMQGNVTIHHDRRGTYLRGKLNLIRGWYNVYNNKFRVKAGKLEFVHAESMRPIVDIEAETVDPEGRKIYLMLSWHQDDIEPRLSLYHEDPGYSETDIWKMLGGGVVGAEDGAGWDALNTAQSLAANYIEKMLNSQMEGITIELETSGGSDGVSSGFEPNQTVVAIGKYLSEGLYVKYKQGLSISTARHFEVEYRLSRLFQIRSEIIMYSEKVIQGGSKRSGDEYNVDLKIRWEF